VKTGASGGLPDRPTAGAMAFLGLLVLWLFRGAVFGGGILYKRDIHLVWYAQIEAFVQAVGGGSWPLWNPSLSFGRPLLADPGAQILYPLTWLNLLVRPWTYYTVFASVHALGSAIGVFFLARRLRLSVGGSAISASIWLLSGPYLSTIDLWHHYAGISWLPWVALTADRAMEAKNLRTATVWGAIQGLQVLAGSADACAMTCVVVGAVLLTHLRSAIGTTKEIGRLLATLAWGAALATCLTAALWWPALEQVARAARANLPSAVRTYWSVHPLSLLDIVVPGLWSSLPLKAALRADLFESREPFMASLYLGAGALALVLAGVGLSAHPWRRTLVVLGGLSLVLALGRHAPVYAAATWALPPLRILRYPVKLTLLVAFAWALLAGMGWEVWRRPTLPSRAWWIWVSAPLAVLAAVVSAGALDLWLEPGAWAARLLDLPVGLPAGQVMASTLLRALVVLGLALSGAFLAWRRGFSSPPWLAVTVGTLALADLATYHRHPVPLAPRSLVTYRPEVLDLLDPDQPRVYVYDYSVAGKAQQYLGREDAYTLARQPEGWDLDPAAALALQMYLAPESAGRWGLRGSYEIDYRGLYPSSLELLTLLLRKVEGTPLHHRFLRMANVTDVVSLHTTSLSDLLLRGERTGLFPEPIRVFRVPGALPRAYAVGKARVAGRLPELAEALMAPDFDPSHEVVLTGGEPWEAKPPFVGSARIVEATSDRVQVEATLGERGYVILVDGFDPGWQAEVDGRATKVLCANGAFRAVPVEAGRHVITQTYRPPSVRWGLLLSAGAALVVVAGLVVTRNERPREDRRADP
jgi:Bacterial membrane protein YfhO